MADYVKAEVEIAGLLAALASVPDAVARHCFDAAGVTARNIRNEAESRLRRQLGPMATGATAAGLIVTPLDDRRGYVVQSTREPMPDLPRWIEHGTRKGKPGSHTQPARPFFDASARLEEGAHQRRIIDAVQAGIDEKGLGA